MKPDKVFRDSNLAQDYFEFHESVMSCNNITNDFILDLWVSVYQSDMQNYYSKPMPWIGMYIASASLLCMLAMVADLLHGFRNRKLWFPCNYFTLNAASLTVIGVAIKLPMDLSNLTPGLVDRTAKLGSLSFMCTIMANLLPSLATMETKELVSNMAALSILVITLVVNVCIQIHTGLLSYTGDETSLLTGLHPYKGDEKSLKPATGRIPRLVYVSGQERIATIYVGMLLMLLIIYACSSLVILKSKKILESKYQVAHQTSLELLQPAGRLLLLCVEKLKQHVSNYWIMAETGSPQFMTVCSPTTSASGVICVLSTALHFYMMRHFYHDLGHLMRYNTSYKWSMPVILVIQFIGVIVSTVAPLSRCFAALSFKLSVKWIWNVHIKVFKVESYWTQKLSDWKQRSIPFSFRSRKVKIVIETLKFLFLSICIGFQKTVVVVCKIIAVIPLIFVISVSYCHRCWKWLKAMFFTSGSIVLVQNPEQPRRDKNLRRYVLQLQDEEFAERTLNGISKFVNRLIQKAENQQPNNLMKLLAESSGFQGVDKFDSHHVPSLLAEEEYLNCWSLPLVTLTTIAISFPDVTKDIVDGLLSGVSEGLVYVTHVEESLNATNDHVSIQKVAKTLWLEVEVYREWLGNKLPKPANTARHILEWLRDTSKNIVTEVESMDIGVLDDNSKHRSISANSMYRITETLMLSNHATLDQVSQEDLFAQLTSMIADILAACLTNLPQVIVMKCHAMEIEKREASVRAAAQLLGETAQIITTLQDCDLPSLSPDDFAFIDKWRAYLKHPFP